MCSFTLRISNKIPDFVKVSPGLLCVGILHGHDAPSLPVGAVNSEAHWGDPDDGAVSQDDRVVV